MNMKNVIRDESGQIEPALVWGIITMLIAIAIGGLIYSEISVEIDDQVDENSIGENVKDEVDSGANTIFPLLVLVVVIGVFVALIGVLRTLG